MWLCFAIFVGAADGERNMENLLGQHQLAALPEVQGDSLRIMYRPHAHHLHSVAPQRDSSHEPHQHRLKGCTLLLCVVVLLHLCHTRSSDEKQQQAVLASRSGLPDGVKIITTRGANYSWAKHDSGGNFQRLLGPHGCLRSRLEVREGLRKLQQELAEAGQPLVER
jgi:hypothetical protein